MVLTADTLFESQNSQKDTKRSAPAAVATYYVGQEVMVGGDDGIAKPVSASVVAGTQVVGVVKVKQVIATLGDSLQFVAGNFAVSSSGFGGSEYNEMVFVDGTSTAFATKGTNRLYGGRVVDFVSGSEGTNDCVVSYGSLVSGSAL